MDDIAKRSLEHLDEFQADPENKSYHLSPEEYAARKGGILNELSQRRISQVNSSKKRGSMNDLAGMDGECNETSIRKLLDGYKRFRDHDLGVLTDKMKHLSNEGQDPCCMVLSCCDSRADPAIIFDIDPGDMFVMRNVANMCPKYAPPDEGTHGTCAAIEYAVTALKVPLLMVLGHAQCGGCAHANAICSKADKLPVDARFIDRWCFMAKDAVCTVIEKYDPQARGRQLELENVRLSVKRLLEYPWIKSAVDAGNLEVRGSFYTIFDGKLLLLGKDGNFYDADDVVDDPNMKSHPLK